MATGRIPTTANSPLTVKGDLFTFSTGSAKLAVGNDGETLVADSAATTGLRYSATPSASNPIINASMQIAQRGTSIAITASTPSYTLDRYYFSNGANQASVVSRQATGDTTNLPNIQYCARVQRNSGQTGTGNVYFGQSLESVNSIPFAGKTVTFSFYARAGANYSATSNAMPVFLNYGTGTDQNVISGYTGGANVVAQTATLTTTWQRFSYSGSVPSTATELGFFFQETPTGTASTNDYFEVTGVQIDVGSVALPFRTYAATIQGELAAAQRYFQKSQDAAVAPGTASTPGMIWSTANAAAATTSYIGCGVYLKQTMRTAPTITLYDEVGASGVVSRFQQGSATSNGQAGQSNQVGDANFTVFSTGTASKTGIEFHYTASAEL